MAVDEPAKGLQVSAFQRLLIPGEKSVRRALEPEVLRANVSALNAGAAVVTFEGKNFFPGTRLVVGESAIDESNAVMSIPTNEALTVIVRHADLASGFAAVYGRYGLPAPIRLQPKKDHKKQLRLSLFARPEAARDLVPVKVAIEECATREPRSECEPPKWLREGEDYTLLVTAGKSSWLASGRALHDYCREIPALAAPSAAPGPANPASATPATIAKEKRCYLSYDVEVPRESLAKEQVISISIPFAGPNYRHAETLYRPLSFDKLTKMATVKDGPDVWLIQGVGIRKELLSQLRTVLGEHTFAFDCGRVCPAGFGVYWVGETAVRLTTPGKYLDNLKQIAVVYSETAPFLLPVPPLPKADTALGTGSKAPEVAVGSAGTVEFTGESFDAVKRVMFAGEALPFQVTKGGTKLMVFLNPVVTSSAGARALAAMDDEKTLVALPIEVKQAVSAK